MAEYSYGMGQSSFLSFKFYLPILIEDLVHWWIILPLLKFFISYFYHIQECLHDRSFWIKVFCVFPIACIYYQISLYCRCLTTIVHLLFDLILLFIVQRNAKQGDWVIQMAKITQLKNLPPPTEEERKKEIEWGEQISQIILNRLPPNYFEELEKKPMKKNNN
jgi:hypothetical protein